MCLVKAIKILHKLLLQAGHLVISKRALAVFLCITLAACVLRYWPREKLTDNILYSQAFYASNGELLRLTLAEDEIFRLFTPLESISPSMIQATCFYEDRYFRFHPGVNPMAIFRGFWTTYVKKQRMMGGSTITMQLARSLYKIDSTTITGKLEQIGYALWIEARYSKDDIMEAYLNLTPYGHNIEGVSAASLIYFGKRSEELSMMEAMSLAVIPQNPVKRLPTSERGWQELKKHRDQLMHSWVKSHPEDMDKLAHFDLPMRITKISDLPYLAPHFVNGITAAYPQRSEYFTTLNLDMHRRMERDIKDYVHRNRVYGIYNASALLIDTDTMQVLAAVGSADFFNDAIEGQVDGTRAKRSPGSLMKPFIYALALDEGIIHPHTLVKDAPRRYGLYSPENSDRGFMGPIFAKDALIHSRNIPAVDLMLELPKGSVLDVLAKSGVRNLKDDDYYGAAIALGGFELSMEEAAVIYSSLNNFGEVHSLRKLQNEDMSEPVDIFTKEAAYITRAMLRQNPPPRIYGSRSRPDTEVAWKTGTSFRFRDGWTAAVFDKYVLVTWVGNFNSDGNPAFMGRQSAAPLAFQIISNITPYVPLKPKEDLIPLGLNVKNVEICAMTGELPLDFCPLTVETLFIPGVSPIKTSDVYMRVPIDTATGLRACAYDPDTTHWEVYEFWPADILELYEKAGIKRKTPPRYLPGCTLEDTFTGTPPVILYPQPNVTYDMDHSPGIDEGIPLIASATGDAEKIFWFVDNVFLGESPNGKPLFWKAERGKHYLQAIDNLGRAVSMTFEVI